MNSDSPLQVKYLKCTSRRILQSTDESEGEECSRPEEVHIRSDSSPRATCSTSISTNNTSPGEQSLSSSLPVSTASPSQSDQHIANDGSNSPSQMLDVTDISADEDVILTMEEDRKEEEGLVIKMTHSQDMVWDSEAESTCSSSTSTPAYKRGDYTEDLNAMARAEIILDCRMPRTPPPHRCSIQILADSRISNWPKHDNVFIVNHQQHWNLQQWLCALRAETIRITGKVVVIYFEKCDMYEDVPPLKNNLQAICKVIHQHQRGIKIFVANTLQFGVLTDPSGRYIF